MQVRLQRLRGSAPARNGPHAKPARTKAAHRRCHPIVNAPHARPDSLSSVLEMPSLAPHGALAPQARASRTKGLGSRIAFAQPAPWAPPFQLSQTVLRANRSATRASLASTQLRRQLHPPTLLATRARLASSPLPQAATAAAAGVTAPRGKALHLRARLRLTASAAPARWA